VAGNILDNQNHRLFSWTNFVKAAKDPRKAASILLHRTLAPIGQSNYRRFIVLTRDRTGSNMLMQALNSHPNIAADYEIFGKLHGESEESILDRSFGKQPFYIRATGFKIFYYHPQDAEDSPIWNMLTDMEDLHVVHLKRRNLLRAEVSSRIAYTTGIYGVRSKKESAQFQNAISAVRFSPEDLDRLFTQNRRWEQDAAERFAGHPLMEVVYEDMVANFEGEYRRVLEFLGLGYRPPRTDFRKQGAKSLRDLVMNYDDLKRSFIGTAWEDYFDE
jgi:LPS sulfotransferase NodH